jgi:hypothetical protein
MTCNARDSFCCWNLVQAHVPRTRVMTQLELAPAPKLEPRDLSKQLQHRNEKVAVVGAGLYWRRISQKKKRRLYSTSYNECMHESVNGF